MQPGRSSALLLGRLRFLLILFLMTQSEVERTISINSTPRLVTKATKPATQCHDSSQTSTGLPNIATRRRLWQMKGTFGWSFRLTMIRYTRT
ncbi:hypothetical protein EDB86DRAFT_2944721 [Lactarius hatsudake]|nr:hypothetical protein EDB86DRAFT_2944721 [Lactarius hatsudake]